MIICATPPAFEYDYRGTDRKCTILYLFYIPNYFSNYKVGDYVLYHHSWLSFSFKTIPMFICLFVRNDLSNSSVDRARAIFVHDEHITK